MITKNIPLNWDSDIIRGNPRNQRIIANYRDHRFSVAISIQDFTIPGFIKPAHIPEKMIYLTCWLDGPRSSKSYACEFRTVGPDTPENREETELCYHRLIFITNKVTNKRPKESKQLLKKMIGVTKVGYC